MNYYHFFDYKDDFEYSGQDFFSLKHIIFMSFALLTIVVLLICLRKTKKENVTKYLKIISIIVPIIEVIKISWETYYDIKNGYGFNWSGLLPLYTCSIFIYTLPFAAWTKGKVQECALGFLTTVGIFGGLTNFLYLQILKTYPLFTFASFISIYFHFLMVFTGLYIVCTKYYRPHMKDSFKAYIPILIISVIVIPVNFIMLSIKNADGGQMYWPNYMMYIDGQGLPILETIENFFTNNHILLLYSFVVMGGYYLITIMFIGIYNLIDFIKNKCKKVSQ